MNLFVSALKMLTVIFIWGITSVSFVPALLNRPLWAYIYRMSLVLLASRCSKQKGG